MDKNVQGRTVGIVYLDGVFIVRFKSILAAIQPKIADNRFIVGREFCDGRQLQDTSKTFNDLITVCTLPLHPVLVRCQVVFALPFGVFVIHV